MTRPGAAIWARDRGRDGIAVVAAVAGPLAAAAVLLPFRASWSNTNVALLLVVVVVAVAAIGNRVAGALAVSQLAVRARRLKVIAITGEGYLALIHQTAALAQSARSPEAVAEHVREQLAELLDLEECRFESGSLLSHPPRLEADGTVLAGDVRWDVESAGLPPEVELRVSGNGQYYGRYLLTPRPGSKPSLQARLVAAALADQAGRGMVPGCVAGIGRKR